MPNQEKATFTLSPIKTKWVLEVGGIFTLADLNVIAEQHELDPARVVITYGPHNLRLEMK